MTLQSGKAGNAVVGSDHVGWVTRYFLCSFNAINQDLVDALLNGYPLQPICRVYVENVSTHVETEIPGVVTHVSVRNNRNEDRGTFSITVRPELISSSFTNIFSTELDTTFDYYIKIKAGYVINGSEVLVQIMKGFSYDRFPAFGPENSSIVINGADLSERIGRTSGIWTGYSSAVSLIKAILQSAGHNAINTSEFSDFSISSSFQFNNNNGIEVIQRLSDFVGRFNHYFDGAGIYVISDQDNSTSPTVDYDYAQSVINVFNPSRSLREYITRVNIVGDGVSLTRQTESSDRTRYGENKFETIQNSLITTEDQARDAADTLIYSRRKDQGYISIAFNPYIKIGTVLGVTHQEVGGYKKYRVNGFTHTFSGTQFLSSLQCERTDFTAPSLEDA